MAGEQIKTLFIPKERNRMDERGDGMQPSSNIKCYDGLNHPAGSRDVAQAGMDLPGMHKALNSIPSFKGTGCGGTPYNPLLRRWRPGGSEGQGSF